MTTAPRGLRRSLRTLLFGAFYRLPGRWRRRLVRFLKPRYNMGAVVLVRASDAPAPGRLLLLRQPPGQGWTLPGGLIDRGESPDVCAARELSEETGIRMAPDELSAGVPNAIVRTRDRWVDFVFIARVPADVPLTVDGAEVYEAVFHPIADLPELTTPTAHLLGQYGIGPLATAGAAE